MAKRQLKKIADQVSDDCYVLAANSYETLRDAIDLATGGDLDMVHLDIVTDIVAKRRGIGPDPLLGVKP